MDRIEHPNRAAIVLAGGDGARLSALTEEIFGHHVPKQFLRLVDDETLLERTLRRISQTVPLAKTIIVLNRAHERFYSPILSGVQRENLVIQPNNRGTAPAIMLALMRLAETGHDGAVGIFPSDHYVSDDGIFMRQAEEAFLAAEAIPRTVTLLGIKPEGPEPAYGWIEPEPALAALRSAAPAIFPIRKFWEKPQRDLAVKLFGAGCLWNSFVLVGKLWMLQLLIAMALPELHAGLARIRPLLGSWREGEALDAMYSRIKAMDFCAQVLQRFPSKLCVLPVCDVQWSDLGDPERLMLVASKSHTMPRWMELLRTPRLRQSNSSHS